MSSAGPRWRDLLLGARLAFAGGRDGLDADRCCTAVGVGLGVALLLLGRRADRPARSTRRAGRADGARDDLSAGRAGAGRPNTLLIAPSGHRLPGHGRPGLGWLQPEGAGRTGAARAGPRCPAPGEMVVSPALRSCSTPPTARCCAPRLDHPIVGTIGDDGLTGPARARLLPRRRRPGPTTASRATRIDHFGEPSCPARHRPGADPAGARRLRGAAAAGRASSSPPPSASAANSATGGWPRCGWSAPTRRWPGGSPPARRRRRAAAACSSARCSSSPAGSWSSGVTLLATQRLRRGHAPVTALAALIAIAVPAAAVGCHPVRAAARADRAARRGPHAARRSAGGCGGGCCCRRSASALLLPADCRRQESSEIATNSWSPAGAAAADRRGRRCCPGWSRRSSPGWAAGRSLAARHPPAAARQRHGRAQVSGVAVAVAGRSPCRCSSPASPGPTRRRPAATCAAPG